MEKEKKFLEAMESDIMNAYIADSEKNKLMKNFLLQPIKEIAVFR